MSPETRQQIIALALGVIFIIGFILFAQRLGQFLRTRQQADGVANETITPSPTAEAVTDGFIVSPTPLAVDRQVGTLPRQPTEIPATGIGAPILASLAALFGLGVFLRRQSH